MIFVKVYLWPEGRLSWGDCEFCPDGNTLKPKRGHELAQIIGRLVNVQQADNGKPIVFGVLRRGSRGYYIENARKL